MALGAQSRRGAALAGAAALRRVAGPAANRRESLPELVLIPQDLRTADPSFFAELSAGSMGLAGATAGISGGSPFALEPPTPEWQAALLGFGWLSDLRASNAPEAYALARRSVEDWLARDRPVEAPDWRPAIAARRLMSWLSNAGMLIEDASPEAYDPFMRGCELHMRRLAAMTVGHGTVPLIASIALVMGCLCLSDNEHRLASSLKSLQSGLAHEILGHGGHVSRHPGAPVELLLDLLPLRQCFMARERKPPLWLTEAMQRMLPMLRHLQLGDRGLGRFNGMAAGEVDRLATVLSYNAGAPAQIEPAAASGYLRLSRRGACVLIDAGPPPPREHSAEAHAGALGFEMSSGPWLMIVNAGAPGPAAQAWRRQSRGTPAHSTLLLNDTSSARLVKDGGDGGGPVRDLLAGPSVVEGKYSEPGDGAAEAQCHHNGYQQRFGMVHARVLRLSAQGDKLSGIDRIFQQHGGVAARALADFSYSIHFHIHPQARVRYGAEPASAEIELRNGEVWKFSAFGSKLGLEDSLYFASITGPTRTVQIVLRGHVLADTQVRWTLERRVAGPEPRLPEPARD